MFWQRKDLLGLRQLTPEEINLILDTAVPMKEIIGRKIKKTPTLRGRSMVTLFYENSTRTRASFELAAKFLSADTIGLAASGSSVAKGESLRDTGLTLTAMGVDVVVMRHPASGAAEYLAKCIPAAVINAGDGTHEHPTQALLDLFTIREKKGSLAGLKVAIVGDILHSRVARSNIWGLSKLGAEVRVAGPSTLLPPELEQLGVKVFTEVEAALEGVDVVNVLRIQLERQQQGLFPTLREYSRLFGINQKRLQLTAPDALIMHPGPMNRGVEIDPQVAYGSRSVINEQVTNGVAVRMALLYLLTGGEYHALAH
ncbi:aspartate carbamoyltransferase catalytic subunit [Desulforamulus hydrothermalis]|uniref:Aspartate carbamoyltransferase n=1 Tax=Desulforamulus hydrothermalis Lam5 = DSM 18033 TaxID=1121428 RepID=K8DXG3_9FIRM|nr:Aspartate carbamoyltransferase [Desulforamulus hydrothermalis Lam5 = DSM 18033]SHG87833.1 aspartate carbamoyltransferase [Desulforamulus hydrothermalis Lam5 = DSM 18033]